ncbi:MAG: acyltransferase [Prevotella sp.]|nr:acyltransferase [Prevotella sp.]
MTKKIKYFEALRGIAIIMVLAIHTYPHSDSSFNLFVRQILNCAVPIFFALSGFFLYKKVLETKEQMYSFWRKQIPKVYIPVLIWSLPWFILGIMHGKLIQAPLRLFSCGYSVYYFIAVIIQFYLLLPLLQRYRLGNRTMGWAIPYIISFISVGFITYVYIIERIHLSLIIRYGSCLYWLCFFVIGCRLSQSDRKYGLIPPLVVMLFGLFSSYYESLYLIENYGNGAGYKLTSFIFSAGMCYLLLSARMEELYDSINGKIANVIVYLGKHSFILYLLHIHVVKYTRIVMNMTQNWTVYFLVVLIISIVLIEIIKKILPLRYHYYLGIY